MAALRAFLNHQWKRAPKLAFNPAYAVELEPEVTPEAERWSAKDAGHFLAASAGDPLGLLFRIILLRGARRGEAAGFRWSGADLDAGYLTVERTILELGGNVVEGTPKTRTSSRKVWLDDGTVSLPREHRMAQLAARLRVGDVWQDNDLVFCREDGSPWPPDYITRRFKAIAEAAGSRSSNCTRDATLRPASRVTRRWTPRSGARPSATPTLKMTSHYTHLEAEVHRA